MPGVAWPSMERHRVTWYSMVWYVCVRLRVRVACTNVSLVRVHGMCVCVCMYGWHGMGWDGMGWYGRYAVNRAAGG